MTWISGARLRTLPLAVAPVILGSCVATITDSFNPLLAGLALALSLSLQVGVNFANDYSDGIRGTDAHRVGPPRLTGSGAVPAARVRAVALSFFALAAAIGLTITIVTQIWWLPVVGALAILAGWFYTGGRRPYGYAGLGELFVFVFFGLVATIGTAFIQSGVVTAEAVCVGVASGLLACAVLMVNNIRDMKTDRVAGKKTLAVRIGRAWAVAGYVAMMVIPFVIAGVLALLYPVTLLSLFVLLAAIPACIIVATATTSAEFGLALKLTSLVAIAYAVTVGVGFII